MPLLNESAIVADVDDLTTGASVEIEKYVSVENAGIGITEIGIRGLTRLEDVYETNVALLTRYDSRILPGMYVHFRGGVYTIQQVQIVGRQTYMRLYAVQTVRID